MSEWYEENFETDVWLRIHQEFWRERSAPETAEKVARVMGLAPRSRILDVPCGIGRLAGALADRGHTVHGVDISEKVLADARAHLGGRPGVTLERGDMRELPRDGDFDAAICWWGSFGFFGDDGDEAFCRAVRGALRPGAPFLIEGFVTESLFPVYTPSAVMRFGDVVVADQRTFDMATSTIHSEWTIIDGDRPVQRMNVDVRLYPWLTLKALLERAGFSTVTLLDAATETPFTPSSRNARTLTLAR